MSPLLAALRPFIARVAAAGVAALAGYLLTTFEIQMDPNDAATLAQAAEWLMVTVMLLVYGIAHKLISRKTNPMDAAAPAASKPSTAVKIGAVPPKEG